MAFLFRKKPLFSSNSSHNLYIVNEKCNKNNIFYYFIYLLYYTGQLIVNCYDMRAMVRYEQIELIILQLIFICYVRI